jgi:hypothetical protein
LIYILCSSGTVLVNCCCSLAGGTGSVVLAG